MVYSARDDMVKVSSKSEIGKCQNQVTSPYFDQLSETRQPLFGLAILMLDLRTIITIESACFEMMGGCYHISCCQSSNGGRLASRGCIGSLS